MRCGQQATYAWLQEIASLVGISKEANIPTLIRKQKSVIAIIIIVTLYFDLRSARSLLANTC